MVARNEQQERNNESSIRFCTLHDLHLLRGELVPTAPVSDGKASDSCPNHLAQCRRLCIAHDCNSLRWREQVMPRFEYDPETYDNNPTFEPNRARKLDKFRREREEVVPDTQEEEN